MTAITTAQPVLSGTERITAERQRQIEKEGFHAGHDDCEHGPDDLALAAVCYALPPEERGKKTVPHHYEITGGGRYMDDSAAYPVGETVVPILWPFDGCYWKPSTRERDFEKAGALIAAELDLRARLAKKQGGAA